MPDRKFTAKPGERVRVAVEGQKGATPSDRPRDEPNGALHAEEDEDLYIRRKKPLVEFLDLGTRLLSSPPGSDFTDFGRARPLDAADTPEPDDEAGNVNEYVEIAIDGEAVNLRALERPGVPSGVADPYSLGTRHVQADMTPADAEAFDRALLGALAPESADPLNPLEFFAANGSGRRLPACAPFPYKATVEDAADYTESAGYPNEAFDVILYNEEKTLKLPNTTFRESVEDLRLWGEDATEPGADVDTAAVWASMEKLDNIEGWKKRKERAADAGERWRPDNLTQGEAQESAYQDMKGKGGRFHLKLDARVYFEPFDTGDAANFKVTREPSPNAEEVEFMFSGASPSRLFLKPQVLAFGRLEEWQAFRTIGFETCRFKDSEGGPAYVHHRGVNPAGDPDFFLNVANVEDAGATPQTFALTATRTAGGQYEITGGPGGAVTVAPSVAFPVVAGLTAAVIESGSPTTGDVFTLDVEPAWTLFQIGAVVRAEVVRGMHVGRFPVMPRAPLDGWDSGLTFNGAVNFSFYDSFSGETVGYDAAESLSKTGRVVTHTAAPSKLLQAYNRHAAKNRKRLVYNVAPMSALGLEAEPLGVTQAEARAMYGAATVQDVLEAGEAQAVLSERADADAAGIIAALESYFGAAIRNAGHATPFQELEDSRAVAAVPVSVPAGALCAVIQNGGTFYVWRRTAEDRAAFDFDRNQGRFTLPVGA